MTKLHDADALLPVHERKCPTIDSIAYWKGKESEWPLLSPVAQWHLNFPTSNIGCERVFGQARVTEAVWTRGSMLNKTVEQEVKFKYNLPVLKDMLKEAVTALEAMTS
jgi:hypothetical protein